MQPCCDEVRPDDQETLMGVRVKLVGLQGRTDLNGLVGRCGNWKGGRYQVFLGKDSGAPLVKPTNLEIAGALTNADLRDIADSATPLGKFPRIYASFALLTDEATPGKVTRPMFDEIIAPRSGSGESKMHSFCDTYYGPVSPRGQVLLNSLNKMDSGFSFIFMPPTVSTSSKVAKMVDNFEQYSSFVKKVVAKDSVRVKSFESKIAQINQSTVDSLGEWLKVSVQIDGLHPPVVRELLVSPELTLRSFHEMVLCPAMGWIPNYHSFAFRILSEHLEHIRDGCWIGPKVSGSIAFSSR